MNILSEAKARPAPAAVGPPHLAPGLVCSRDSRPADFFEVFLSRLPNELLHLLPHPQIPSFGPGRAVAPLPFPLCRRRSARSSAGRSATVTDASWSSGFRSSASRRFTIALPHANLFWTGVLTVDHRRHSRLRLFRHPGLRAGAGPGESRFDLRAFFSVSLSAWPASAPPSSASWPIAPASTTSFNSAPSCR